MPDPTREQYNAAVEKVMQSAPDGISRDQFYALIEKELTPSFSSGLRQGFTPNSGKTDTQELAQKDNPGLLQRTMSALEPLAHPKSVGDFLSLLIPAGIPNVNKVANQGGEFTVKNVLGRYGGAMKDAAKETSGLGSMLNYPLRVQQKAIEAMPSVMARASAKFRGAPGPAAAAETPTILPNKPDVWDAALADRKAIPQGRIAGKAPDLNDELVKALEGVRGDSPMAQTTLPADIAPAGGGPVRQSGKFGRSGSKGQAGGYTSGNPPTRGIEEALTSEAPAAAPQVERRVNPSWQLPEGMTERRMDELVGKFGGTQGAPQAGIEGQAADTGVGSLAVPTAPAFDAGVSIRDQWLPVFKAKGLRETARLAGKTPQQMADILEIDITAPRSTPSEAVDRIQRASQKAAQGE